MSKFIKVPEPVEMIELASEKPTGVVISLKDFIFVDVADHPMWNVGPTETRALKDIVSAVNEMADGIVRIPDGAYPYLKKCVEAPEYRVFGIGGQEVSMRGYKRFTGAGLVQVLCIIEAILDATDKEPRVVDTKDNGAVKKQLKQEPAQV